MSNGQILCIGNAIVDVIARSTDDFLAGRGLDKGSMRLIDEEGLAAKEATAKAMEQVSGPVVATTAVLLAPFTSVTRKVKPSAPLKSASGV